MQIVDQVDYVVGGPVLLPSPGRKSTIVDSDGLFKVLDSTGAKVLPGGSDGGTLITLSGAATNIDITGLNGDTDGDYEVEGVLLTSAAGGNLTMQPNALATNQRYSATGSNGSPLSFAGQTVFRIMFTTAAANTVSFRFRFSAKTGVPRIYTCISERDDGTNFGQESGIGRWTDTSTTLTSIRINTNQANGLLTNSFVRWRKLGFTA